MERLQSGDDESKEEEDAPLGSELEPEKFTFQSLAVDEGKPQFSRPSREHVVQLLRSLHQEQLVELLTPFVQNDYDTYSRLVQESESDVHRRKLFVHGLPARTTEDQFRRFFEQYGDVELVELPHAKAHSEVKFGFVVFSSIHSLHAALEQPNKQFEGKEICCKVFTIRATSSETSPMSTTAAMAQMTTPNRKIFVSGLASFVGDRELYEHFRPCGEIEVAQVLPGKSTGSVLFTDPFAARDAIFRLNKSFLGGRQITVAWYRKQEDTRLMDRRPPVPTPQVMRAQSQAYGNPSINSGFTPPSAWYNYHTAYVQQDPFMLVPMPVYQPEFQVDSFFSRIEDQDVKF